MSCTRSASRASSTSPAASSWPSRCATRAATSASTWPGSNSVLDAMVSAGTPLIVFSSSCTVYGTPDTNPVTEDTPLRPENPYGASKMMVEQMLRWYGAGPRHPLDEPALLQCRRRLVRCRPGRALRQDPHAHPHAHAGRPGPARARWTSTARTTPRRMARPSATTSTWWTSRTPTSARSRRRRPSRGRPC